MKEKRALVIGSGVAGLAASIRLRQQGYAVDVFEANAYPGGKLAEIRLGGYRFDAGPSLFTLPEEVEDLFRITGRKPEDFFTYEKLDITCHYFWEGGKTLKAYADPHLFATEAGHKFGEPAENILAHLNQSAFMYDKLAPLFMYRSLHRLQTWTNTDALKAYGQLHKLGLFSTMHQANAQALQHPKLVQLFNRYATYNGSNPYETPATLNIIPHLEFNKGAFFPKKGMHDITQSLYKLAQSIGVQFHLNSPVEEIIVEKGKALGVVVSDQRIFGDLVVNNMDMVNAYKTILRKQKQPKRLLNQPKSSSALIFYWGIRKEFPELGLHNILFSEDYQKEFDYIFNRKEIYKDPTVYINITSVHKPDDAPKGGMNWFTMINVPNNQGQNWEVYIRKARRYILEKVERVLGTDISPLIEVEEILDPRSIESKTSSAQGALYGNSSNNRFSAFLRHANYSPNIKNLYFCGGSVHPGGGIPLALLSARIVSEMIEKKQHHG